MLDVITRLILLSSWMKSLKSKIYELENPLIKCLIVYDDWDVEKISGQLSSIA